MVPGQYQRTKKTYRGPGPPEQNGQAGKDPGIKRQMPQDKGIVGEIPDPPPGGQGKNRNTAQHHQGRHIGPQQGGP